MLGIDTTRISRFKNKSKAFIEKVLHPKEIEEYFKSENKELFLASRWAIKESLFKADNHYSKFSEIYIKKKDRIYLFKGFIITTTKEDDYYFAVVMKEKNAN